MKKFKLNINFLNCFMYIQAVRNAPISVLDNRGYSLCTDYKLPNFLDMQFLAYILSVRDDSFILKISCRSILKGCGKGDSGKEYQRLAECMRRWKCVTQKYSECFYESPKNRYGLGKKSTKEFKIIESWNLDLGLLTVQFNKDWIAQNQSKYSLWMPFDYYKNLSAKAMRLFEILYPQLRNSQFEISLVRLGEKMALGSTKPAHVFAKVNSAMLELAEKTKEFSDITYKIKDKHRRKDRSILFIIADREAIKNRTNNDPKKKIEKQFCKKENNVIEEQITVLWNMLKTKKDSLRAIIKKYHKQEGFEYVRWNILYANENANKKYYTYLKKALMGNWAIDWAEDKKKNIDKLAKTIAEEKNKIEEEKLKEIRKKELDKKQNLFQEKQNELSKKVKENLWRNAKIKIPEDKIGRKMHIKINYAKLLREYLNTEGNNFSEEVVGDLQFINKVAWDDSCAE